MLQDHVVSEPNVDTAVVKAAMPRRTGQSATQWRQPRGMGVSVHAPVLACLPVVLPCSLLNGPQLPFRRDANETWAVALPKTSTWTVLPRAPKRLHCCSDCHDDEITGADDGWASASWQWPRRQCCLGPARAVLWVCLHASTLARISSSGDPPGRHSCSHVFGGVLGRRGTWRDPTTAVASSWGIVAPLRNRPRGTTQNKKMAFSRARRRW